MSPAVETPSLNHWTASEVLAADILDARVYQSLYIKILGSVWKFPDGTVVTTPRFHFHGPGFDPCLRN